MLPKGLPGGEGSAQGRKPHTEAVHCCVSGPGSWSPFSWPRDLCCSPGFLSKRWQEAGALGACALVGTFPMVISAASVSGCSCPGPLPLGGGAARFHVPPREGTVLWQLGGVSGTVQTLLQLLGCEPNGAFRGAHPLEDGLCSVLSREAAAPAFTASPLVWPAEPAAGSPAQARGPLSVLTGSCGSPWAPARTARLGLPVATGHKHFFSFFQLH